MRQAHLDRLTELLAEHDRRRADGSAKPENRTLLAPEFRDAFSRAVRTVVLPILEEGVASLRHRVERASLFHQLGTAGMRVKLDQWEDYERTLVFYGDPRSERVRITHEGTGFSRLAAELRVDELDEAEVERQVYGYLDRLLAGEAEVPAVAPRAA